MDNFDILRLLLFVVPVLLSSILMLYKEGAYKKRDGTNWGIIFLVYLFSIIIPVTLAFVSFLYYDINRIVSVSAIVLIIISHLITTFAILVNNRVFDFLMVMNTVFPILLLGVMIPKILTTFNNDEYTSNEIDISLIEKSFSNIESSFKEIDEIIETETSYINELIIKTRTQIESKNSELKELNQQQIELQEQMEQYKQLSTISEEQAKALLVALNRNKYLEYLIGFGIGLLSSIAAAYIFTLFKKRKTVTNNV
jgi:hypothetical protein